MRSFDVGPSDMPALRSMIRDLMIMICYNDDNDVLLVSSFYSATVICNSDAKRRMLMISRVVAVQPKSLGGCFRARPRRAAK